MKAPPTRLPLHAQAKVRPHRAWRWVDRDLLPAVVLLWVVSVVRVVGAFVRHETFGSEATLALLAVVATPFVILSSKRRKRS